MWNKKAFKSEQYWSKNNKRWLIGYRMMLYLNFLKPVGQIYPKHTCLVSGCWCWCFRFWINCLCLCFGNFYVSSDFNNLNFSGSSSCSDGAAALVGAGDPCGRGNQQRRAHDTQPDRAHKAWILRGAPHTHHAFRRGWLHHPDRHLQRWVLCINSRDMAFLEEKCRETWAGGRHRRATLSLILRLHRWKNYNYSLWCHPSANSEIVFSL